MATYCRVHRPVILLRLLPVCFCPLCPAGVHLLTPICLNPDEMSAEKKEKHTTHDN